MGEDSFRELEAKCLRETSNLRDVVIGCGGGTAAFHGNMDWMKAHGLTVFLNTSFDILVQRIAKNDSERPLFQGCDKEEIMKNSVKLPKNAVFTMVQQKLFGIKANQVIFFIAL